MGASRRGKQIQAVMRVNALPPDECVRQVIIAPSEWPQFTPPAKNVNPQKK